MSKYMVTGGAGFIGSHIVDGLLEGGHQLVVYDNLSTGKLENLSHCMTAIEFVEADLRDLDSLMKAMEGVEGVFHEAALGSVPRSVQDPATTNSNNVNGTLNVLLAARASGVKRVVNASSSSVYGDAPELPKHEGMRFMPKSPYALSKVAAEEYARLFFEIYGLETVSLRYFNVFGPRQDPNGAYAAVIPKFITAILHDEAPVVNGDGTRSRDFTYVKDVVAANLLAMKADSSALGKPFNVGAAGQTTLLELIDVINRKARKSIACVHGPERAGDVQHSRASIEAASNILGYEPRFRFADGIGLTVDYFRHKEEADLAEAVPA